MANTATARRKKVTKKAASKKKTVAPRKTTEVAPEVDIDIGAYAGMGNEEVSPEDYALPILRILQKMSPQVDENEEGHVEGAKAGMFFNTVTNEAYDGDLTVVPVLFRKELVEWVPRDAGGGFVAVYDINDPIKDVAVPKEEGSLHMTLPESGNDLVDTYNQYVICVEEGGSRFPALISMTSTQVKKAKQWNSLISQQSLVHKGKLISNPPRWAFLYKLATIGESNDYGSFYNFNVTIVKDENGKPVETLHEDSALFTTASSLYEALKKGEAKADYAADAGADGEGDGEIPF